MRRALGAALLGSFILMMSPAVAHAHADVTSSIPRNGAQVAITPAAITVTFGEPVTLDTQRPAIINGAGVALASTATMSGTRLSLTPSRGLGRGNYAVTWHVISDDGHAVAGAISFTVGRPGPRGAKVALTTTPAVATVLSGRRAGPLTVTFAHAATSGEVEWTNPALPGTITWKVVGAGRTSSATGVLPIAGTWTMTANLVGKDYSIVVLKGSTSVR
ncbi:MAG: copper resistance protein CopC [bacterium]|nr:copper resistance protein CopC [bacterium]